MIVTRKKPVEQVLAMLRGVRRVALVGCASCAAACQTGGEKELEQMRQLLQEQGIETVGTSCRTSAAICCSSSAISSPCATAARRPSSVWPAATAHRLSRPIPRSRLPRE